MDNLYLHHKKLWCIVTRIRCVVRSTECAKPLFISGTVSHLFQLNPRKYVTDFSYTIYAGLISCWSGFKRSVPTYDIPPFPAFDATFPDAGFFLAEWRNWQARWLQVPVPKGVRVQIPFPPPDTSIPFRSKLLFPAFFDIDISRYLLTITWILVLPMI